MLSWVPSSGCSPRGAEVLAESMGQAAPCPQSPLLSIFITHQKKKKKKETKTYPKVKTKRQQPGGA